VHKARKQQKQYRTSADVGHTIRQTVVITWLYNKFFTAFLPSVMIFMQIFILFRTGIHKFSKISRTHLQNVGATIATLRKLRTEDSKFLSEF